MRSDKAGTAQMIIFVLGYMFLKLKWSGKPVVRSNRRHDTTHATFSIARHSLPKTKNSSPIFEKKHVKLTNIAKDSCYAVTTNRLGFQVCSSLCLKPC